MVFGINLNRKSQDASALYEVIVTQARRIEFYEDLGVPDTVSGRFDLIVLHMFFVMRRLKKEQDKGLALSQALFDCMFADMDKNMRETGVGDLAVGKNIRSLASAFYGRIKAYEDCLENNKDELSNVIIRNVYDGEMPNKEQVRSLVDYFIYQHDITNEWSFKQISETDFSFVLPTNRGN